MLCDNCYRLIGSTDTVCPHCGAAVNTSEKIFGELDDEKIESTIEFEVSNEDERQEDSAYDSFESVDVDEYNDDTGVDNPLTSDDSYILTDEITEDEDNKIVKDTNRNALETAAVPGPREVGGYRTSRLLIAVAILSVLALLSSAVLFVFLPMQQQSKANTAIVDFLEGAWISDHFAFIDSTSKNFVEVLVVDGEGNFTMLYTVPDAEYPDGWSTGKWKIEDKIEGTITYLEDEQRLLLLYEKDGVKCCFERFFITKEENKICLREIYDETGEAYYDVILHRINM